MCESNYLETLIIFCIILNVFTMAMSYEGSTHEYDLLLKNINYFFSTFFIVECFLKNLAYK